MNYQEQIQRIKSKLIQAKESDKDLKVFGARSHKYVVGKPLSEKEVSEFEEKYQIQLPACYRSFLLEVGNGGCSYARSAAGPFYGIFPLGGSVGEIMDEPEKSLGNPVAIRPHMGDGEWEELAGGLVSDENIPDEEYDRLMHKVFGGVLPLGSQGCTYIHAILLNGEHSGKVVNLSLDIDKPVFTFEKNFLDWYERWLDEVIAGVLQKDSPTWYGYSKGGTAEELMQELRQSKTDEEREDALRGVLRWETLQEDYTSDLRELVERDVQELSGLALKVLTKFDYANAGDLLEKRIQEEDNKCLLALQCLHWYAKDKSKEWVEVLKHRLPSVNDPETFRFMGYLLEEAKTNYSEDLKPFLTHDDSSIRRHAHYFLGKLVDKEKRVEKAVVTKARELQNSRSQAPAASDEKGFFQKLKDWWLSW